MIDNDGNPTTLCTNCGQEVAAAMLEQPNYEMHRTFVAKLATGNAIVTGVLAAWSTVVNNVTNDVSKVISALSTINT